MSVRTYYDLAKPGIIYGNALPFIAAFILAVQPVNFVALCVALLGQSLIIGGSCVYNNMLDRGIDKRMSRTQQRALVTGQVRMSTAAVYGGLLCVIGVCLLVAYANWLTAFIGLFGILSYVLVYGYAKRFTPWSTLIGSIPGALPPIAGYTAAAGRFDMTALLLGLLLVCWQMPHFYAIALYRAKEYAAANLPVLAVTASAHRVRVEIMLYISALLIVIILLGVQAGLGLVYYVAAVGIVLYWLLIGVRTWRSRDAPTWARRMFFISLSVLLVICAAIPAGVYLS